MCRGTPFSVFGWFQLIFVMIPCILNLIFISTSCNTTTTSTSEIVASVFLLLATIVMLILTIIFEEVMDEPCVFFTAAICWIIQFIIIMDIFTKYNNNYLTCNDEGFMIVLYVLFCILMILYSIMTFIIAIALSCMIYDEGSCGCDVMTILCTIIHIPMMMLIPILQMVLISNENCNGEKLESLSIVESIFLMVFMFSLDVMVCIGFVLERDQRCCVVIYWLVFFIIQYGLLCHSFAVWLLNDVHCDQMEGLRLFLCWIIVIYWIECTLILLAILFVQGVFVCGLCSGSGSRYTTVVRITAQLGF